MQKKERLLWKKMSELTWKKCNQKCKSPGACCDPIYCEIAKKYATACGIKLQYTGNKIPFLDDVGICIVLPHLRPLCTIHQCEIANIGLCADDPEWTDEYYVLRNQLEDVGFDEMSGLW